MAENKCEKDRERSRNRCDSEQELDRKRQIEYKRRKERKQKERRKRKIKQIPCTSQYEIDVRGEENKIQRECERQRKSEIDKTENTTAEN